MQGYWMSSGSSPPGNDGPVSASQFARGSLTLVNSGRIYALDPPAK